MRKPAVDYRGFRFSRINDTQFSHLWLLLSWFLYFALYFLTEYFIPVEACTPVYCFIDDLIPFCEWFVIPYVGWYFLIVVSLLYFALYNPQNFRRLQIFIIVTQIAAISIYIAFPNCQNLRPEQFPRENLFTHIIRLLYSIDTNTGVCPSLHCAYSIGIASVWLKEKSASTFVKTFIVIFCLLVCLSTMFIKQHSAVDFFASIPVCVLAEVIACGGYWKEKIQSKKK